VFDTLLHLACALDIMTPAMAFALDLWQGPAFSFSVPDNAGWNRPDLKRLLTQHGVRVWGLMFNGDHILFTVPSSQAEWAAYLLENAGVPTLNARPVSPTRRRPVEPVPDTPFDITAPLEGMMRFLDKLG
jgi:hypothetical protein